MAELKFRLWLTGVQYLQLVSASVPRSDMLVFPCREGFACQTPETPKFAIWSLVQPLARCRSIASARSGPDHLWFLLVSPKLGAGTQTGLYFRCSLANTKRRRVITPLHLLALLLLK